MSSGAILFGFMATTFFGYSVWMVVEGQLALAAGLLVGSVFVGYLARQAHRRGT